ncbi:MAG: exosortase K [Eubacterium sp.]|nr:exosortase K [Eubacterium sp.]
MNLPLCIAIAVIVLVMNYFCRTSDSDALTWILTPTTRWVSVLSGISFEYLPHQGYVNHFHQFLIAAPCAGSRFLLLTFLMLVFSFPVLDLCKKYLWFGFSMVFAYVSTIFVNGIRITVSIYLPVILEKNGFLNGWLTHDRLHTLIGTVSYFTFLCVIYWMASVIRSYVFDQMARKAGWKVIVPAFWYLLIVLALPFAKRLYHNEWDGFGQYAAVVVGVCVSVCMGVCVVAGVGGIIGKRKESRIS